MIKTTKESNPEILHQRSAKLFMWPAKNSNISKRIRKTNFISNVHIEIKQKIKPRRKMQKTCLEVG